MTGTAEAAAPAVFPSLNCSELPAPPLLDLFLSQLVEKLAWVAEAMVLAYEACARPPVSLF